MYNLVLPDHIRRYQRHLSIVLVGVGASFGASAAVVSGSIIDDNNVPVAGATVTLTTSRPAALSNRVGGEPVAVSIPQTLSATAGIDGKYSISSVPAGAYSICVNPNDRKHVNNCSGRILRQTVGVAPDSAFVEADPTVAAGAEILLTVEASAAEQMPSHVFLSANNGSMVPMQVDAAAGRIWAVVPPLTAWRLVTAIAGRQNSLPSETIQAGKAGASIQVTVSR